MKRNQKKQQAIIKIERNLLLIVIIPISPKPIHRFESSRKYNGDAKTSKVWINKLKLTTDSTKTWEDATKLEKLVFGDEGSKKLTKQQTSSELEDTGKFYSFR